MRKLIRDLMTCMSSLESFKLIKRTRRIKLDALNQSNPPLSSDAIDWIMNANVFNNPIVKETMQKFVDDFIFELAKEIAENPSGRKIQ